MLANQTADFAGVRLRTLGDIEVISWVAIECCERGVHVDAVLRKEQTGQLAGISSLESYNP